MSVTFSREVDWSTCLNRGAYVTERFGRVFGDRDDRTHRCPEYDRLLSRGSATGVDVGVLDPRRHSVVTGVGRRDGLR